MGNSEFEKCETCKGSGQEHSGVEYVGQREVIGCEYCMGTGYADPVQVIESLKTRLERAESKLNASMQVVIESYRDALTKSES
jgi:DnaJ-class molecular chaperone